MNTHITFDLETLGLTPDSVILSFGGIVFNPFNGDIKSHMYAVLETATQIAAGRIVDQSTDSWWNHPDRAAIKPVYEGPPNTFLTDLYSINNWIARNEASAVWVNGLDFDVPMLSHAFKQFGVSIPWKYNAVRDVRTISKEFSISPNRHGTHHNALDDSMWNVAVIQRFYQLKAAYVK